MKIFRHFIAIACIAASLIANAGEQVAPNAKCAASQPIDVKLQPLQGRWEGGVVDDPAHQKVTITITGNSLHFHRDTNFWFETTITLPAGKEPRELHATIKDCASGQDDSVGKVVVALYKIEDAKLTLAPLGGGDEEPPKSFEAVKEKGLTRYELWKAQPQKGNVELPKTKGRAGISFFPALEDLTTDEHK